MQHNRTPAPNLLCKWAILAAVITQCGCAMPLGQLKRGSEDMVPAVKPDTEEPAIKLVSYETEPNELTLDVVTLLPAPEPDDTGSNEFHASPQWEDVADLLNPVYETGRELDADECYVQAMAATGLGHLIDIERQLHRCLKTTKRNATQKRIVDRLLCYRAEQERNRAAGESLETFYGLAEVESQKQLLDRTSKATNKLAQAAEGVKDSGIDAKIDLLGIELQQLEVKRRYSELQKNESTLQFNLRRLIGEAPGAPVQILPVVDWDAPDFTLTRDEAVQTAFEARAELKALNYLLSLQEKDALPSTRQQLRTNDASLGSGITGDKCLLKLLSLLFNNGDSEIEQCFRVRQLRELRAETVRLIEVEVSAAHFAVSNRLQILALAKAEADRRAEYISQIEAARTTGNYQYQDLADARIRLLAAEANVIHELYALRIDEAKLRQSQGLFCE